jgi:hypothetical protein
MENSQIIWVSAIVLIGFVTIMGFEIRIVTYLKQMRDLLKVISEKK